MVRLCADFIRTGHLPPGLNRTHIVLIPKKSNPQNMGDLRPIALCNVIYKIITKVITNRMKPLLNELIFENQSAFILGKLISDNVMIAYEAHHYLKRKTQGKDGYVSVKLDMSKAFDRVEWDLLRAIMLKMGFSLRWVNLIMECVSTAEYFILNEGNELGPVLPHRGLRQGDPLSPTYSSWLWKVLAL